MNARFSRRGDKIVVGTTKGVVIYNAETGEKLEEERPYGYSRPDDAIRFANELDRSEEEMDAWRDSEEPCVYKDDTGYCVKLGDEGVMFASTEAIKAVSSHDDLDRSELPRLGTGALVAVATAHRVVTMLVPCPKIVE